MRERATLTCKSCSTSIEVLVDNNFDPNWVCTPCRTKGLKVIEVFPSVDPSIGKYIDQRTTDGHTLSWWRQSDFFRHTRATVPLILYPTTRNLRGKLRMGKEMRLSLELTGQGFEPFDKMLEWGLGNIEEGDLLLIPDCDGSPIKTREQFRQVPQETGSILAPIRGRTLPEMEKWVKDNPSLDGYYVSPRNELGVILSAVILQQEYFPTSRLHIRGISGSQPVELLGTLLQKVKGQISVETSSHLAGVTAGVYFRPQMTKTLVRLLKGNELDSIPCGCPVCLDTFEFGGLSEKAPARTVPIMLHNLYQFVRFMRIYENITPSILSMKKSSAGVFFTNEVLALRGVFDYYLENGWKSVRDHSTSFGPDFDANQVRLFEVPSAPPPTPCPVCGEEEGIRFTYPLITGEVLICENCLRFYQEAAKVLP